MNIRLIGNLLQTMQPTIRFRYRGNVRICRVEALGVSDKKGVPYIKGFDLEKQAFRNFTETGIEEIISVDLPVKPELAHV